MRSWCGHPEDDQDVTRLTELNRQIVTGEREYAPFAYLDDAER